MSSKQWFRMLYHVNTMFPERGRPSPIITLIMFKLFFFPLTHSNSPKVYLNPMKIHSTTLELQDAQLSDTSCRDIQSNITLYLKDYSISKNDLLLYKEKMVFPDNPSLKLSINESKHASPLAEFSWPGMTRDFKNYVNSCYDCNHKKSSNHHKYGLLQPLPIPPLP
ncbi:hypothetical protein VP01_8452g1 [Puccinia sorghi]|uniref:Integrase zinc-binding domain-containing protein n=1 Tax=Puccinia sorghi TaxID=27349 RepID=A0A0L6UBD7_9BASI|nr:hypothetical protein VP01_8452g1 [Puccinia sorghi]